VKKAMHDDNAETQTSTDNFIFIFIFKQLICAFHAISVKTFGQQLFCSLEIWFYDFVNVFFILVLVVMQKGRRLLLRDNLGVKDGRFCSRNRKGYLMHNLC
jgi:hypothetical protein